MGTDSIASTPCSWEPSSGSIDSRPGRCGASNPAQSRSTRGSTTCGTSFYPVSQALETLIFAMLLELPRRSPRWNRAFAVVMLLLLAVQTPAAYVSWSWPKTYPTLNALIYSSVLVVYLGASWRVWPRATGSAR